MVTPTRGADLTLLSRLGGHSHARTYRPTEGMAGSSLVFALKGKCEEYLQSGRFKIVKKARVTAADTDADGRINGVRWTPSDDDHGRENVIKGRHVLLATGGYSNDKFGDDALLNKFAHISQSLPLRTRRARRATGTNSRSVSVPVPSTCSACKCIRLDSSIPRMNARARRRWRLNCWSWRYFTRSFRRAFRQRTRHSRLRERSHARGGSGKT